MSQFPEIKTFDFSTDRLTDRPANNPEYGSSFAGHKNLTKHFTTLNSIHLFLRFGSFYVTDISS